MIVDWLLLVACSLMIAVGVIFMRAGMRRGTTSWGLSLYVGLVPCVIFGPFAWRHVALFPPWYAALLVAAGAVAIVGIWALNESLHRGPVGPTFLIRSYSILVPVAASVLFYGESLSVLRVTGLLIVAASVPLLQSGKIPPGADSAAARRANGIWLLYMSLTFVAFGLADTAFRDAVSREADYAPNAHGGYVLGIVLLGYLGNMVGVPIGLLLTRTRPTRADAIWGTATGLVNGVAFLLVLLVVGSMGGVTVFPARLVISVACAVVLAAIFFRERPDARTAAGLVLGTVGVILLGIKTG
ncbi:MAG: hypothetical protein JXL80_04475 [Planctomycetes bacterium]|nr:hypothetical protein [Planctomycetota bacterium]